MRDVVSKIIYLHHFFVNWITRAGPLSSLQVDRCITLYGTRVRVQLYSSPALAVYRLLHTSPSCNLYRLWVSVEYETVRRKCGEGCKRVRWRGGGVTPLAAQKRWSTLYDPAAHRSRCVVPPQIHLREHLHGTNVGKVSEIYQPLAAAS